MATLHIDLREGWQHHAVSLSVGGREAWSGDDVTTRMQTGLARQAVLQVPAGEVPLRVAVEGGPTEERTVTIGPGEAWVGISLVGDRLEFREQETEFGYV